MRNLGDPTIEPGNNIPFVEASKVHPTLYFAALALLTAITSCSLPDGSGRVGSIPDTDNLGPTTATPIVSSGNKTNGGENPISAIPDVTPTSEATATPDPDSELKEQFGEDTIFVSDLYDGLEASTNSTVVDDFTPGDPSVIISESSIAGRTMTELVPRPDDEGHLNAHTLVLVEPVVEDFYVDSHGITWLKIRASRLGSLVSTDLVDNKGKLWDTGPKTSYLVEIDPGGNILEKTLYPGVSGFLNATNDNGSFYQVAVPVSGDDSYESCNTLDQYQRFISRASTTDSPDRTLFIRPGTPVAVMHPSGSLQMYCDSDLDSGNAKGQDSKRAPRANTYAVIEILITYHDRISKMGEEEQRSVYSKIDPSTLSTLQLFSYEHELYDLASHFSNLYVIYQKMLEQAERTLEHASDSTQGVVGKSLKSVVQKLWIKYWSDKDNGAGLWSDYWQNYPS